MSPQKSQAIHVATKQGPAVSWKQETKLETQAGVGYKGSLRVFWRKLIFILWQKRNCQLANWGVKRHFFTTY